VTAGWRAWRCRCGSRHGLRGQRPGEAREADLGVASGNGKGQIFVRASDRDRAESQIVETLIEEAMRLAEQGCPAQRWSRGAEGQPVVTTY